MFSKNGGKIYFVSKGGVQVIFILLIFTHLFLHRRRPPSTNQILWGRPKSADVVSVSAFLRASKHCPQEKKWTLAEMPESPTTLLSSDDVLRRWGQGSVCGGRTRSGIVEVVGVVGGGRRRQRRRRGEDGRRVVGAEWSSDRSRVKCLPTAPALWSVHPAREERDQLWRRDRLGGGSWPGLWFLVCLILPLWHRLMPFLSKRASLCCCVWGMIAVFYMLFLGFYHLY